MFKFKHLSVEIDPWGGLKVNGEYASYESIIRDLHPEVEWLYAQSNNYQGDWYAVGHDKQDEWFFHNGSFGSCSVCDWLMSICNQKDAIDFLKMMDRIIPIGKIDQAIQYLEQEKVNSYHEGSLDVLIKEVKQCKNLGWID